MSIISTLLLLLKVLMRSKQYLVSHKHGYVIYLNLAYK